jgi:hypothetical protein
MTAS